MRKSNRNWLGRLILFVAFLVAPWVTQAQDNSPGLSGADIRPASQIPEPTAALLFAAGAAVIAHRGHNRRK